MNNLELERRIPAFPRAHHFDGPVSGCSAAALRSEQRDDGEDDDDDDASWKPASSSRLLSPCSGRQMGAVCSILCDESSRIQPLNTQQMGHFPSSAQLSLSSQTTYSGDVERGRVF